MKAYCLYAINTTSLWVFINFKKYKVFMNTMCPLADWPLPTTIKIIELLKYL